MNMPGGFKFVEEFIGAENSCLNCFEDYLKEGKIT